MTKIAVRTLALLLLLLSLGAVPAAAQTCPTGPTDPNTILTNANGVCFAASLDHDAVDLGQPVLTEYRLDFFLQGTDSTNPATQPFQQVSLGKPTPVGPNKIILLQRNEFGGTPVGQAFYAVVESVGPNGSTRSAPAPGFFGQRSNRKPAAPASTPTIFHQ